VLLGKKEGESVLLCWANLQNRTDDGDCGSLCRGEEKKEREKKRSCRHIEEESLRLRGRTPKGDGLEMGDGHAASLAALRN
jgi:hypothetical protein